MKILQRAVSARKCAQNVEIALRLSWLILICPAPPGSQRHRSSL